MPRIPDCASCQQLKFRKWLSLVKDRIFANKSRVSKQEFEITFFMRNTKLVKKIQKSLT